MFKGLGAKICGFDYPQVLAFIGVAETKPLEQMSRHNCISVLLTVPIHSNEASFPEAVFWCLFCILPSHWIAKHFGSKYHFSFCYVKPVCEFLLKSGISINKCISKQVLEKKSKVFLNDVTSVLLVQKYKSVGQHNPHFSTGGRAVDVSRRECATWGLELWLSIVSSASPPSTLCSPTHRTTLRPPFPSLETSLSSSIPLQTPALVEISQHNLPFPCAFVDAGRPAHVYTPVETPSTVVWKCFTALLRHAWASARHPPPQVLQLLKLFPERLLTFWSMT